ncbi:hypothetical protein GW12_18200 [Acinetobacter sp. HR7]|nr:hypothetical protein GW12_18200 [Acinetobacter sp. HR7]
MILFLLNALLILIPTKIVVFLMGHFILIKYIEFYLTKW